MLMDIPFASAFEYEDFPGKAFFSPRRDFPILGRN
jgi:hypothetical protein